MPCVVIWNSGECLAFIPGDRYGEEPRNYSRGPERSSGGGERLDEIEDWDRGSKKNIATETIGKVKDFVNRMKGFDEPPDYKYVHKCYYSSFQLFVWVMFQ